MADAAPQEQAAPEIRYFIVPLTLQPHVGEQQSITFLQPRAGHQLTKDAVYAVRCNEVYVDAKAAFEGERSYVRNALVRASSVIFYRCFGTNPVFVMTGFEDTIIHQAARAAESVMQRVIVVKPEKVFRLEVASPASNSDMLYRIMADEKAMQAMLNKYGNRLTFKPSHIKGLYIAHTFMNKIDGYINTHASLEAVRNIVSSEMMEYQVTIRCPGANTEDTMTLAKTLQGSGISATSTVRAPGTVRATLPIPCTPDSVKDLRNMLTTALGEPFAQWRIYTDTPLSAWTRDPRDEAQRNTNKTASTKPAKVHDPAVQDALEKGACVIKISADHLPRRNDFNAIATALGGTKILTVESKFTEVPQAAIISCPPSQRLEDILKGAFAISDLGHWTAVAVKPLKTGMRK